MDIRYSHEDAMKVRKKPTSNKISGAGVQKGQAIRFRTEHPNIEIAKHEVRRKELGLTYDNYCKEMGYSKELYRHIQRGSNLAILLK